MDEYPILDRLTGPDDLKDMNSEELHALAAELRQGLIQTISRVGGHFAPNLGVIELTVALYKSFNLPQIRDIEDAMMRCAIVADQSPSVYTEDDR